MSDAVLLDIADSIATITLNEPEVRNAFSNPLREGLRHAIASVENDPAVRCVVIRGAGDHFQSGGDIRMMQERQKMQPDERTQEIMFGVHLLHHHIFAMRRMGKPVVASVQGAVAGAGIGLLGACDLAIAADDAIFTLAYCHIGASPDGGSTYFLGRTIGMKHLFELAFLGDRFGPDRAKELGLINWVVPRADLEVETAKLAKRLANGPTHAYANAKKLYNQVHHLTMESQLQMEGELIADSMTTEDFNEGVSAFMEKRKAAFKGR